MKKNNYIQPVVEVMTVNAVSGICQVSLNAPLNSGGGTDQYDPEHYGL